MRDRTATSNKQERLRKVKIQTERPIFSLFFGKTIFPEVLYLSQNSCKYNKGEPVDMKQKDRVTRGAAGLRLELNGNPSDCRCLHFLSSRTAEVQNHTCRKVGAPDLNKPSANCRKP